MSIRGAVPVVARRWVGIRSNCSLSASRALVVAALAMLTAAGYMLVAPATAEAAACPVGTWADYMALSFSGKSCTIDDKTFSNFGYVFGDGGGPGTTQTLIFDGDVTVTPILTPGNPGFIFSSSWTATTTPGSDSAYTYSDMSFDVQTTSGDSLIKDASLASVYSPPVSGLAGAKEDICLGASQLINCPAGSSVSLDASSGTGQISDSKNFATQSLVGVDKVEIS